MQPMIVTVGPLAGADADIVATSQTCPGAFCLALNGAYSSGFDADAIALAQAVGGAGALTLSGANVNGGIGQCGVPSSVTITSAGNDSGITFTIAGMIYGPNGYGGAYQSEVVTGSNTSIVATTKLFSTVTSVTASGAAAGNVSVGINGTVTLDEPRRILITSGGNDTGITFTVNGTDWNNNTISQAVTGASGATAVSTLDFATITSIQLSGASAGTVTIGTNGVAGSRPIFMDRFNFAPTALQVSVTGTVNFTVQQSLDDPNDVGLASVNWVNHPDSSLVAATGTAQGNYAYAPQVVRIVLNSGSGSVKLTIIQAANVPL